MPGVTLNVKEPMTRDIGMQETVFIEKAKELMPYPEDVAHMLAKFGEFIILLTEHLKEWKEASLIQSPSDLGKVRLLRQRPTFAFTATALNIIGCVGFDLFNSLPNGTDWHPLAIKFASLD